MNWEDSVASKCRYGGEVGEAFNNPQVLWERSLSDYQGYAKFVGWDGARIIYYSWAYGSCSGCDNWEQRELAGEKLMMTIRGQGEYFEDAEVLRKFLHPIFHRENDWMEDGATNVNVPFDDLIESARIYLAEARENDPEG